MILVDRANRVLLLGVADPATLGDDLCRIIPDGGLEAGESFEAAARREIREETGIWSVPSARVSGPGGCP